MNGIEEYAVSLKERPVQEGACLYPVSEVLKNPAETAAFVAGFYQFHRRGPEGIYLLCLDKDYSLLGIVRSYDTENMRKFCFPENIRTMCSYFEQTEMFFVVHNYKDRITMVGPADMKWADRLRKNFKGKYLGYMVVGNNGYQLVTDTFEKKTCNVEYEKNTKERMLNAYLVKNMPGYTVKADTLTCKIGDVANLYIVTNRKEDLYLLETNTAMRAFEQTRLEQELARLGKKKNCIIGNIEKTRLIA